MENDRSYDGIQERFNRQMAAMKETEDRILLYVDRILAEKDRATELASHEREQASAALTHERDEAATALAHNAKDVTRTMEANLRLHIHEQVAQIQAALRAEGELSKQRDGAIREQIGLTLNASIEAAQKAERSTEKRFENVNEFRAQQADIIKMFPNKAVVEAQLSALSGRIDANLETVTKMAARVDRAEGRQGGVSAATHLVMGAVVLIISVVAVLANVLTGG